MLIESSGSKQSQPQLHWVALTVIRGQQFCLFLFFICIFIVPAFLSLLSIVLIELNLPQINSVFFCW